MSSSPCQSDKDRLEKIKNDVECMLLLQEATNPHGVNCKLICVHNDDDFEVEVLEEVEPQRERCSSNGHHRAAHNSMPPEGVLIKLAYNPKPKSNGRSSGPCLKHTRSVSPSTEHTGMDNLTRHKVISAGTLNQNERDKRSQIRCIKNKLKEMEETLKAEIEAKAAAICEVTALRNERAKLHSENCRLRNNADCLDKVKSDSAELSRELSSLKEERSELKSFVEDQTNFINTLERKFCKLRSENKRMHQEGENKIQGLVNENLELSNQIQSLNSTLTCMRKEMELKGKKCNDDSAVQASQVREGKNNINEMNDLTNEVQSLKKSLCEKDKMLQSSKEQIECLKSQLCKAKGEMERSIGAHTEVANLLNETKEKLAKSEAALKNAQLELCRAKKELEKKEMDLKSALEEKDKEIAALYETNECLKQKLCSKSPCGNQKLSGESRNEKSHSVSFNLRSVNECMAANENESYPVVTLETTCCANEGESQKLCALQEELERTSKALEHEKIESKKKCKVIQELRGNLELMKENENRRLQELQNALREKEQAERSIKISFNQERRQNEKLLDELTELKWQERELSRQLCETHAQLVQYESSMSIGNECMEHSRMLEQIEQEVEMKTVQWKEYVKRLTKERDDAINAAKFASQNLMSSVADFQRHMGLQRKIQQMLIDLLHKRDDELRNSFLKASKNSSLSLGCEKENDL